MGGTGDTTRGSALATLDRSVILSQLLFGAVVVVFVFTLLVFVPESASRPLMLAGAAVAFVVTGLSVVIPWHRLPRDVVMLVPIVDIVAVGLMRLGDPAAGVGLLWVFPTLWLASYFGLRGAVIAVSSSAGLVWLTEIITGRALTVGSIPGVVLLPMALLFVATSAVLTSRRTNAQRVLLRTQAGQVERALRRANRQESLIAEVLNAVDFGVVRLDREGHGAVMNTAYARLYRLDMAVPDAARLGVAFAEDRVTPLTRDELPFNRAARGDEFDNVITWIPRGGAELAAVAVTSRRLYDDDNEPDGSVLVARDVTAELLAVRARDDLVASVSHELRTPMTSVLGFVDLSLDEPDLPSGVRRNLEIMERNGERMLQLIASILQSARQADAPSQLELGDTDLGSIVLESVESLRPRSDERALTVTVTTAEHVIVRADHFRIRQVVDNVLSNAIKYNHTGGEVTLGVTAEEDTAWIVVRDGGIGIPEAELPRVFDRFFRSESVRQGSVHGSGLGLGIARDFVELHGGRLSIDSEEGRGTTVIITLPVSGPGAA
ncbi:sensor histidine kinase [Agromyces albus]|uniref:sensor histidine kinase n=1 Tax=Agromyces albus TaxID=205332 RepID=UPI0027852E5D|nr:PAS domain-containing sensor histidine kinase [Agromyces albus]MDQ0574523.1 two-component system phosphate regulon sensor histidine kinase PhoR [Agromyces albus]